jgi:hypothetical protein
MKLPRCNNGEEPRDKGSVLQVKTFAAGKLSPKGQNTACGGICELSYEYHPGKNGRHDPVDSSESTH